MKKTIIIKKENVPIFKQIEKLCPFDKKESAFFKAPRKNIEKNQVYIEVKKQQLI